MSKVGQSSAGASGDVNEAARLASLQHKLLKEWPPGMVLVLKSGNTIRTIVDKNQLDMASLSGVTQRKFMPAVARSDGAQGVDPQLSQFRDVPQPQKHFPQINPAPKGKLPITTPKPKPNVGVATGARPRGPSNTGPFGNAKDSRTAQDVLTRMKHGTVTTLDGGWGPKSEKAFANFMDSLGLVAPQDTKEATRLILHLPMTAMVPVPEGDSYPLLTDFYVSTRTHIADSFRAARKANDKPAMLSTLRDLARLDELSKEFTSEGRLLGSDVPAKLSDEYMSLVKKYPAPAADPYATR